jgi:hypothetical protein
MRSGYDQCPIAHGPAAQWRRSSQGSIGSRKPSPIRLDASVPEKCDNASATCSRQPAAGLPAGTLSVRFIKAQRIKPGFSPPAWSSIGLLRCIAFALHALSDCGTNLRRPRDRGHDPAARRSSVFTTHGFGRGRAALLKISFVSFRHVVAPDRRIVGSTPAHTKQQDRNKKRDAER